MAIFLDLPEDLVMEIMSWLPPECLGQFKCVQKSWNILINALVKSPWFTAKHLYNSNNKISSLIFMAEIKNFYPRNRVGILTFVNDEDNTDHHLSCVAKEVDRRKYFYFLETLYEEAHSHCNGIVCFALGYITLLCNPTTTEYKYLPNFCKILKTMRVGFGYDPIDDVYKVVRVFGSLFSKDLRAQVYTLGSDSWREIKMTRSHDSHHHDYYYLPTTKHVYCKGVYYWLLSQDFSSDGIIQSFKMRDEEFHSIPLPVYGVYNTIIDLTQLNGSVALFYYPRINMTGPIEVFVMHESNEDYKSSHCWTKLLSIGLEGTYKIPIAFWKSDELLLREPEGLVSYNILIKNVRSLHFQIKDLTHFRAFSYVKSLVPLSLTTEPEYYADGLCL